MANMWDTVAGGWEHNADRVDAQLADATVALLDAAQIDHGAHVADVATGAGSAGIAAAGRVGASGRVVLVDSAPAMVDAAARRSAALDQVSTMVCDQSAVDAPAQSFDAVICRHGLMFAEPPQDAVREAVRLLRPGGRYATVTWAARAENPWLGVLLDAVGEQFGGEFPPPGVAGPFSLEDPTRLTEVLEAGGLEDVHVERVSAPMRLPSLEAWWELVPQLAGPLAAALAGMQEEVRGSIARRALERGATVAHASGDGIEFDGAVLVGSGRRG